MPRPRRRHLRRNTASASPVTAIAAAALALTPRLAHATTASYTPYTWIGTASGNWSDPANWKNGVVPVSGPDAQLNFYGTPPYAANNDLPPTPFTLYDLYLASGGASSYSVTGNPLRFVPGARGTASISHGVASNAATVANDLILDDFVQLGTGSSGGSFTLAGAISGNGSLNVYGSVTLTGHGSYSGGTLVRGGWLVLPVPGATLGTGPVTVGAASPVSGLVDAAYLGIDSAANLATSSAPHPVSVYAGSYVAFRTLDAAALATITPDSTGALALVPGSPSPATLDLSATPLLRIGSVPQATYAAGPATLAVALTPAGRTYRFGGQPASGLSYLLPSTFRVTSLLTDDGPAPRSVDVSDGISASSNSGSFSLVSLANPDNSYSGGTSVRAQSRGQFSGLALDFTPAPGQTPLGTGPLDVYATLAIGGDGSLGALPNDVVFHPGSRLFLNDVKINVDSAGNAYYTSDLRDRWPDAKPLPLDSTEVRRAAWTGVETVGPVSFAGGSILYSDPAQGPGSAGTVLQTPSLTRVASGTLFFHAPAVSSPPPLATAANASDLADPATGMLPAYLAGSTGNTPFFLTTDAAGNLTPFPSPRASFDPTTDTDVVKLYRYFTSLSADEAVHALLLDSSPTLTLAAGKTLTIRSGGLAGYGTVSGAGSLSFADAAGDPVEALLCAPTVSSSITIASNLSAASLTFFGDGYLTLSGSNSLPGGVHVNGGVLVADSPAALGSSPADVHLDVRARLLLHTDLTLRSLTGQGALAVDGARTLTLDTPAGADTTFAGALLGAYNRHALSLTKTGPGALTLSGPSQYNGLTSVAQGTLTLAGSNDVLPASVGLAPVFGDYATAPGARLNILTPYHFNTLTGTGSTTVGPDATLTTSRIQQSSLTLFGHVTLTPNPFLTPSTLGTLTLNPNASLDITTNTLLLSTPASTIRQYLHDTQLTSSAADPAHRLAYTDTDPTTLLVTLALTGDANLDGFLNADDYILLDRAYARALTDAQWQDGDFNYDGLIDQQDYLLIDTTLGQAQGFSPAFLSQRQSQFGPAYVSALLAAVPEPSSLLSACGLTLLPLTRRRRASTQFSS